MTDWEGPLLAQSRIGWYSADVPNRQIIPERAGVAGTTPEADVSEYHVAGK